MSTIARTIGGPIAETSVRVADDCTHFCVHQMSLMTMRQEPPIKGTYKRISGIEPPRFLWQGWEK